MRSIACVLAAATLVLSALAAGAADRLAVTNVTIIDVEDGRARPGQTVIVAEGHILQMGDSRSVRPPEDALIVDGVGRYLVPGFWDMHVHSHRAGRWRYHYPLFLAHGVVGVRDAGTHFASAVAAMERIHGDPLAPTVVWGSPPLDGPKPVLSFGLGIESEAAADHAALLLKRLGFDFIKTYDRLSPDSYRALARAAGREGLRLEGHVPLAMSPADVATSGHALIDHLTLVIEACTPGGLEHVHARVAAAPGDAESILVMSDPAWERLLADYDAGACRKLFGELAARGIRQVPTLIQARGYFLPEEARRRTQGRAADVTPQLMADWEAHSKDSDPRELAAGAAIYRRQLAALRDMQDAGVPLMVGTDVSSEAWVFAGSSVHDEMALFVEGGLTPLEALQAATLRPLQYVGRANEGPVLGAGAVADLVLLDADPRVDIDATRAIHAVIRRGRLFDRAALDALLLQGRAAASEGGF